MLTVTFPSTPPSTIFIDPLNVAKRKQWLSERERRLIEALNPYEGGNDFLLALHRLDIKRKHERLIRVQLSPSSVSIKPEVSVGDVRFPTPLPGFQDGAVIAWTAIDAPDCDVNIAADVTFSEADLIGAKPLIEMLRQFAGLADSIVQMFE